MRRLRHDGLPEVSPTTPTGKRVRRTARLPQRERLTDPSTPTGLALAQQGRLSEDWGIQYASLKDILAIETEAAAAERERLREELDTTRRYGLHIHADMPVAQARAMQLGFQQAMDEAAVLLADPEP